MEKMKRVMGLIRVNWRTMAGFELLYKLLSISVFTPLFWGIFNGIMKVTGYEYLTIENILPFLVNPLTLVALLLLFACMAVYTMVDIGAVIFLLDQSYQGNKVNLVQTLKFSVQNAVKVFQRENIAILFVVLFLIPFLNLGGGVKLYQQYIGSRIYPGFYNREWKASFSFYCCIGSP